MAHEAVDARFHAILDEHAPVRRLGTGYIFTEGPLWHPLDRHLLFSDMPGDVRRRWTPDGRVTEVQRPSNKGNGLTYDADLNLLVCEHATSAVARIRPDGTREVLCTHFEGRELNSPNDIVVAEDGGIWFTDPTFGRMEHFGVPRPVEMGFQGVYRLPPGHRPGDEPQLVSDRYMFSQPNGLCFSPCGRWMWVNDTAQANIRMFDVAADGRLGNARIFAGGIRDPVLKGVPDGMKADIDGNLYVTAPGGVWVYDFDGLLIGRIRVPEMVANLHWGGEGFSTLFLCAMTSLYAVETRTRGRIEPFMRARASSRGPSGGPSRAPSVPSAKGDHASRARRGICDDAVQTRDRPEARPAPAVAARLDAPVAGPRTALILQDLQNDVISAGGAFADSGAPAHAAAQGVVANARRLAEAARARGVMVLHVWMVCEPGHPHLAQHCALMQGLKGRNALVRGSWGAAPVAGLEPQPGDLVVEKMSMSAWETTRLESYLRHGQRDTLINCGAWTNMSVEHTARTAADKGFRVILPEDACSTMNADWHRASIGYAMGNVATVTTVDAVLAALV